MRDVRVVRGVEQVADQAPDETGQGHPQQGDQARQ